LLYRLFPQVEEIYSDHEWQASWSKNLRVCATKNFDSYFTLIPGGDEEELNQYEIETILSSMSATDEFEKLLNEYIEKKKIKKVLERIQGYTNDSEKFPQDRFQDIVQALFNISDNLPMEETGFFGIDSDVVITRIILKLFKRENDKQKNYKILRDTIPQSKGIFGPIQIISLETPRDDEERNHELLLEEGKLQELQKLCIDKIKNTEKEKLLRHKNFLFILYSWKEWGIKKEWKKFISDIQKDEILFWLFLKKFISESKSQIGGDYGYRVNKKFNHESLETFLESDEIKKRIEESKGNSRIYNENKEVIDLFLRDKKDEE
jgi:hypothetical protein